MRSRQTHLLFGTISTRSIIILGVALALLSSALITSHHFHLNLETQPDCAICKSASDLSSGDKQDAITLIPQDVVQTAPVIPQILSVYWISARSLNNRAPPA